VNKITKQQDIGLIAHELQEIYPELVTGEKDGPETQSINYIGLIPILINEIKSLKTDIKTFKMNSEVTKMTMKTEIQTLKDNIDYFIRTTFENVVSNFNI
jgi:hypothetical protein